MERILTFDQALAEVLNHAAALPAPASESVRLLEAAGRVLAASVHADRDQPPFDRSTRDGYAVRAADLSGPLSLIGQIRAGEHWTGPPLAPGQAVEIMTGAPVPAGADAVLMVEHAELAGDSLQPARTLRPGENIVPRAAEARAGQAVLPRGRHVRAAEIAVAASCGCSLLSVYKRPTVAIVSTGDELVDLDATPGPSHIRNSNSYALATLVATEAAFPQPLPIARDTLNDLSDRLHSARASDLLLLTGGVSMGKYDLVEHALTEAGAEFFFTGALIQPGKPIVFGRLPKPASAPESRHPERSEGSPYPVGSVETSSSSPQYTYFFGLPGNPVSTQVCFHLFVAPLLRAIAGATDPLEITPRFVEATLAEDVPGGAKVTRFLPAELSGNERRVHVRLTGWQGSGDLAANARGNGYCVLPADTPSFAAGETVRVLLR